MGDVAIEYQIGDGDVESIPVYSLDRNEWEGLQEDRESQQGSGNKWWSDAYMQSFSASTSWVIDEMNSSESIRMRVTSSDSEIIVGFFSMELYNEELVRRDTIHGQIVEYSPTVYDGLGLLQVRVYDTDVLRDEGLYSEHTGAQSGYVNQLIQNVIPHGVGFLQFRIEPEPDPEPVTVEDELQYALELHDEYLQAVSELQAFRAQNSSKITLWETIADLLTSSQESDWPEDAPKTDDLRDALGIPEQHGIPGYRVTDRHIQLLTRTRQRNWGSRLFSLGENPIPLEPPESKETLSLEQLAREPETVAEEYTHDERRSELHGHFYGNTPTHGALLSETAAESYFVQFGLLKLHYQLMVEKRAMILLRYLCSSAVRINMPSNGNGDEEDASAHFLLSGNTTRNEHEKFNVDPDSIGPGFYGAFVRLPYTEQVQLMAQLTRGLAESHVGQQFLLELLNPGSPIVRYGPAIELTTMNAVRFFDPSTLHTTDGGFEYRKNEGLIEETSDGYHVTDGQLINPPEPDVFNDGSLSATAPRDLEIALAELAENLVPGMVVLADQDGTDMDFDGSVAALIQYEVGTILSTFLDDPDAQTELQTLQSGDFPGGIDEIESTFGVLSGVNGLLSEWIGGDSPDDIDFTEMTQAETSDLEAVVGFADTVTATVEHLIWGYRVAVFAADVGEGNVDPIAFVEEIPTIVNVSILKGIHESVNTEWTVGGSGFDRQTEVRYHRVNVLMSTISLVFEVTEFYEAIRDDDFEAGVTSALGIVGTAMSMLGDIGQFRNSLSVAGRAGMVARFATFFGVVGLLIQAALLAWSIYQIVTADGPLEEWIRSTAFGEDPVFDEDNPEQRYFLYNNRLLDDPFLWQLSGFYWLQYPFGASDDVTAIVRHPDEGERWDPLDPHDDTNVVCELDIPDIRGLEPGSTLVIQKVVKIEAQYYPADIVHVIDVFEAYRRGISDGIIDVYVDARLSDLTETGDVFSSLVTADDPDGIFFKQTLTPSEETMGDSPTDIDAEALRLHFEVTDMADFEEAFGWSVAELENETAGLLVYHVPGELSEHLTSQSGNGGLDWLTQFPRVGVEIDVETDLDEVS